MEICFSIQILGVHLGIQSPRHGLLQVIAISVVDMPYGDSCVSKMQCVSCSTSWLGHWEMVPGLVQKYQFDTDSKLT